MSVRHHDRATPGAGAPDAGSTAALGPGDLVRWHGLLARVAGVGDFGPGARYVTLEFPGTDRLPLSLAAAELDGSEVWHAAGDFVEH